MKILNHEFFSTSTSNLRQNRGSQSGHTTRNLHISMSSSFKTYHRIVDKSNTTAVTSGAGIANHFGASEFTPPHLLLPTLIVWGSCCSICQFSVWCFIDHCWSFVPFPLVSSSIYDTSLVFSNFSSSKGSLLQYIYTLYTFWLIVLDGKVLKYAQIITVCGQI